jgi:hypothetical protein
MALESGGVVNIRMTEAGSSPTLVPMSRQVLTKRRAVDLCRTTTCLCLDA